MPATTALILPPGVRSPLTTEAAPEPEPTLPPLRVFDDEDFDGTGYSYETLTNVIYD